MEYYSFFCPIGRLLMEDMESVKINIHGMCVRNRGCSNPSFCYFCCLVKDKCYGTDKECMIDCPKTSPVDLTAAMAPWPAI